jgi:hypothetical protein
MPLADTVPIELRLPRKRQRTSILGSALALLACIAGVWACYAVAIRTPDGQRLDTAGMVGASIGEAVAGGVAREVLDVVSGLTLALACVFTAGIAVARRRPGVAVAVFVLVGGANVTTQALKAYVFTRPNFGISEAVTNSFPSGHTTVAASVTGALMIAVGSRLRPVVALVGAAYTGATGLSTVIMGWHRPSDAVAAVLIVGGWTAAVILFGAVYRTAAWGRGQAPAAEGTVLSRYYAVVEVFLLICGAVGVVAAFVLALGLHPELNASMLIARGEHLGRGLMVRASAMSAAGIIGVSMLLTGAALALLPPRETPKK